MSNEIKVAVVDDHPLFANSLAKFINDFDRISATFIASNGADLLIKLELSDKLPDVILLDYQMPVMDGQETTKELKRKFPECKVLILSNFVDPFYIKELLKDGADGYLFKSSELEEFEMAIREVLEVGYYYNKETIKLFTEMESKGLRLGQKDTKHITEEEKQILRYLCKELTSIEIGKKMKLSKRTVENKISRLLEKTNSRNAKGLVMYAVRNHIAEIG